MTTVREPGAVLADWYTGELGGEALFWQLASGAEPTAARKWLALAEVEARVATRLVPALLELGLEIPDGASSVVSARARSGAMAVTPWLGQMQWLEDIAQEALDAMALEARTLPAALAAIGCLVVAHEQALVDFARLERAGDGTHSLRPIHAFLAATATA